MTCGWCCGWQRGARTSRRPPSSTVARSSPRRRVAPARAMTARNARVGARCTWRSSPLGHLLGLHVTAADAQDRAQVAQLAEQGQAVMSAAVEVACVDQGYTGDQPAEAAAARGIQLEVVKLPEAKKGVVRL